MTILVFGQTGQVARALAAHEGILCLSRAEADLSKPGECAKAIERFQPSAVINAAAYTAVDKAEDEEALASLINGHAPGEMAKACAVLDIPFVSISTDYVFDGSGEQPWSGSDTPAPISAYGRSKLIGETQIRGCGGRYAILRTSWVISAHGSNFVKTMLRLGRERDALNVVNDQIGAPTAAKDIAETCLSMVAALSDAPSNAGIYHYSGTPETSWYDVARTIFDKSGIDCDVQLIPTSAYPTPAKRPLNSRLDCASLEAVFGIKRPDWTRSLDDILKDLGELNGQ